MSRTTQSSRLPLVIAGVIIAAISAAGGYGLAHLKPHETMAAATTDAKGKVLYWYDPMVPAQHFEKPGKSPFMDMQLVARYADEGGSEAGVSINPAVTQNLGVRLATVSQGEISEALSATGVLDFNQRDVAVVQSKAMGFVQRVYGRAPGDVVRAGAPIADILVPSWSGAQAEYLAVLKIKDPALEAASRQRLRLLGMSDAMIETAAKTGRSQGVTTITAPVGGVIQALDVRQGMTVNAGQTLAQINGLSTIWLNASVPESMAGQVREKQSVRVTLAAFPSETFSGRVTTILPTAQADSRTLLARIELANRDGRLKPGMFGTVRLDGEAKSALLVPTEAVIRTGKRDIVMLAGDGGKYRPVEVKVGREANGQSEILEGLSVGQKVVASGQFLIDSEGSLAGLEVQPLTKPATAAATPALYETRGRIEAISGDHMTLSHEPVPAINWPAMTMTFTLTPRSLATGLKAGDEVRFGFEQLPAGPVIRTMEKTGGAK